MNRNLLALIVIVAGVASAAWPLNAEAITCMRLGAAAEELRRHSAVFEGVALQTHRDQFGQRVRLRVLRSWKGPRAGEHFELWYTNPFPSEPGGYVVSSIRRGGRYLVFALPHPSGRASQGIAGAYCSPTRPVGEELPGLTISDLGPPS